jgi:hypothetical protein
VIHRWRRRSGVRAFSIGGVVRETNGRYGMRYCILPALTGASSLPLIYDLTRGDRWITALMVVLTLGTLGGVIPAVISKEESKPSLLPMASAFVAGAFASGLCGFTKYYIDIGHRDPELVLGVVASALEFCGVAAVGGTATSVGAYFGACIQGIRRAKTG